MPITQQQINQAKDATNLLQKDLQDLFSFIVYVQSLENSGWKFTVNYTNTDYPVSQNDQTALLNNYTALKNKLVTDFSKLP